MNPMEKTSKSLEHLIKYIDLVIGPSSYAHTHTNIPMMMHVMEIRVDRIDLKTHTK